MERNTKMGSQEQSSSSSTATTSPPPLPSLCVTPGCDFYGSIGNRNMCSKCYANFLKEEIVAKTSQINLSLDGDVPDAKIALVSGGSRTTKDTSCCVGTKKRCDFCNKKVRVMWFECRCGKMLCGDHRYPDQHRCTFDFKKFDRQILVKQNPLIKGQKLDSKV